MRLVFSLFICGISFFAMAQTADIHTTFPLETEASKAIQMESDFAFTAIVLKSTEKKEFQNIGFIYNSDTLFFNNSVHSDNSSSYFYSTIIHLDQPIDRIDLFFETEVDEIEVVLINGSGGYSISPLKNSNSIRKEACELNGLVQQSEWRNGLPEPDYNRIFTNTQNIVVHHSAGSNNISDYTQAVRDIYILHTEENGWSDIGYNYLIAPNGVIYAGRDPGTGKQDQVMGAHFCGSNSNTMGICLLGNYEILEPSSVLLESLESALSWKAFKDNLEVLESSSHPLNSNLPVIAGHQDGCSTLCPGVNVYTKLSDIRLNVNVQVAACRGEEEPEEPDEPLDEEEEPIISFEVDSVYKQMIYPNPISSNFSFSLDISENRKDKLRFLRIFNHDGKQIEWQNLHFSENRIEVTLPNTLAPGIYFLSTIFSDGKEKSQRFLIQ